MPAPPLDLLLISPPPWDVDSPPVNLAVLSSYLEAQGLRVGCLDLNVWLWRRVDANLEHLWRFESAPYWKQPGSFEEIMDGVRPHWPALVDALLARPAAVYGISIADGRERMALALVRELRARRPEAKIVLGGPSASSPAALQPFLDAGPGLVDAIVRGEGELTLHELLQRWADDRPVDDVAGLFLPTPDGLRATAERPRIDALGQLPWPTYAGFDLSQYRQQTLVMVWSRGCVARCSFCDVPAIWGRFRFRPAAHILAELRHHVETLGVRDFMIFDSIVNGDIGELERLCDAIVDAGEPPAGSPGIVHRVGQRTRRRPTGGSDLRVSSRSATDRQGGRVSWRCPKDHDSSRSCGIHLPTG